MAEAPKNSPRPLSPHLQIYRWPLGMAMSIMHRASGAALAVGTLMIIWMLLAAAYGPSAWQDFNDFASSGLGQVMLFGWTAALFYHLCNGVRHLIWDTAHLFKLENANRAGLVVL
ncbi:MAG: succinate dehydrogenase, cytochrome b556 subunit, partial [Alphaproteobacteria bacterium]|nr:succinate dehydrogenase, cytochrome b556 subunit [Alphaproteobacteria bacterium]